ncbi:MAG: MoaD/ThiS family protein [Candidatus Didemnitutus sp.]|nr:MoaD/ThiS family protein [Candidatus Didemnitutus sp.]
MDAELIASQPIAVTVRFFALLREQAGCGELVCSTTAGTPRQLYAELATQRGLTFPEHLLGVAVNERYAALDAPLGDGDRIVFIPPVAGG